jgi:quercetin dioxygenase-like cupin family protein
MFGINSQNGYSEITQGIKIKTLCYGNSMLMTEFLLKVGALLPEHSHPNEQTGYLVKGKIKLFIEGISREIKTGDSWCIKENTLHKAEILEDSIALEIFSPLRNDYLKYVHQDDILS